MPWLCLFVDEAQRGLAALLTMDRRLLDLGLVERVAAAAALEDALGMDHFPELGRADGLHRQEDLADLRVLAVEVQRELPADRFRELLLADHAQFDRDAAE